MCGTLVPQAPLILQSEHGRSDDLGRGVGLAWGGEHEFDRFEPPLKSAAAIWGRASSLRGGRR